MLGDRIAALRSRLGWSQAELARRLHISSSSVGMYEQGRREPSLDVIISLSRVLGVSIDYLLTGNSICRRDVRAQATITGFSDDNISAPNVSSLFSKDELMVLLAASVLAGESE